MHRTLFQLYLVSILKFYFFFLPFITYSHTLCVTEHYSVTIRLTSFLCESFVLFECIQLLLILQMSCLGFYYFMLKDVIWSLLIPKMIWPGGWSGMGIRGMRMGIISRDKEGIILSSKGCEVLISHHQIANPNTIVLDWD